MSVAFSAIPAVVAEVATVPKNATLLIEAARADGYDVTVDQSIGHVKICAKRGDGPALVHATIIWVTGSVAVVDDTGTVPVKFKPTSQFSFASVFARGRYDYPKSARQTRYAMGLPPR